MAKKRPFDGKTTRLAETMRNADQERIAFLKNSFTTQEKEFKRATFTLTTADIAWLSQTVKDINRSSVRETSKSELVRIGLHLLKTHDLRQILQEIS